MDEKTLELIEKLTNKVDVLEESNKELMEKNKELSETVAKLAGVSRGTLYNNEALRDRIRHLRAGGTDQMCDVLREKNRRQEERLRVLRRQVRCLEEEKQKLLVQLIDHEELRRENERLLQMIDTRSMLQ